MTVDLAATARLWDSVMLAAAQADLGHRRDRAKERLNELVASGKGRGEPTVRLAAAATLRVCDHPALDPAAG